MKAAIYTNYGGPEVVHVETIPTLKCGDNEVLVKVLYTAVTAADARIRSASFPKGFGFFARLAFGVTKPRKQVLGSCFSGIVTERGKNVKSLSIGDEVCGMNGIRMGAHAEYITVDAEQSLALKPREVSHKDAAAMLFGGTAALYFLRDLIKLKPGETILINGASGAVGTNAVQLAKEFGAIVTGVTDAARAGLVKDLGAFEVIDYKTQDILDSNLLYDAVLDTVGTIHPKEGKRLLSINGRLALMVASLGETLYSQADPRVLTGAAPEKKKDIEFLLNLMATGKLIAIIDSEYTLTDIAKAHARVSGGNKKGNVVVR